MGRRFEPDGAYNTSKEKRTSRQTKILNQLYAWQMEFPLITERLVLRPLTLDEIDSFVGYRRDPEIARFQGWDVKYSDRDARVLIESQSGKSFPDKGDWLQIAILSRLGNEHVGDLALHAVPSNESIFEIGFTIAKRHQGQGFAREAASILMEVLSSEVGATKFVANSDSRNTASIRLLEALEFKRVPSRSWTENFKNEIITMEYFESH